MQPNFIAIVIHVGCVVLLCLVGCVMLLCHVVCMTLLAFFFLPSSSLINNYIHTSSFHLNI